VIFSVLYIHPSLECTSTFQYMYSEIGSTLQVTFWPIITVFAESFQCH